MFWNTKIFRNLKTKESGPYCEWKSVSSDNHGENVVDKFKKAKQEKWFFYRMFYSWLFAIFYQKASKLGFRDISPALAINSSISVIFLKFPNFIFFIHFIHFISFRLETRVAKCTLTFEWEQSSSTSILVMRNCDKSWKFCDVILT